jgi:hypothetical protein
VLEDADPGRYTVVGPGVSLGDPFRVIACNCAAHAEELADLCSFCRCTCRACGGARNGRPAGAPLFAGASAGRGAGAGAGGGGGSDGDGDVGGWLAGALGATPLWLPLAAAALGCAGVDGPHAHSLIVCTVFAAVVATQWVPPVE